MRPRPRLVVLAGALAMAGSLTALAALVAADVAHARQPAPEWVDDDTPLTEPVRVTKVVHHQVPDFLELVDRVRRERVHFGTFEGY